MTINAPIPLRHDYTGNNIATKFRYSVEIDDPSFLEVIHTDISGVETTLVLDTDYTVGCATNDPGAGVGEGGNVIFPETGSTFGILAIGERLSILYDALVEQTLSIPDKVRVLDENLELKLDYIIKLINQANEFHARALKLAKNSTGEDTTVPIAPSRSIGWDSLARNLILLKIATVDVDIIEEKGDIVQGDVSGDPERLPIGTAGSLLHVVSGLLAYHGIGDPNTLYQVVGAIGNWLTPTLLLKPIIADLSNILHTHEDAASGGVLAETAGKYIQVVNVEDNEIATGSIIIPADNTIPQNDEGSEFMTATITPTSEDNILEFEVVVMMSYDEGPSQE